MRFDKITAKTQTPTGADLGYYLNEAFKTLKIFVTG